jgi:hypothetical protein
MTMRLNEAEAESLRAAGTKLKEFLPAGEGVRWGNRLYLRFHANFSDSYERRFVGGRAKDLGPGDGLYGLETDCGYLQETPDGRGICSVHEDPTRKPRVCGEFTEASQGCVSVRERRGVGMDTAEINLSLVGVALGEAAVENFDPSIV